MPPTEWPFDPMSEALTDASLLCMKAVAEAAFALRAAVAMRHRSLAAAAAASSASAASRNVVR